MSLSTEENVVIQFATFRGGAVSEAVALDTQETGNRA